jgi:hypothetical protein
LVESELQEISQPFKIIPPIPIPATTPLDIEQYEIQLESKSDLDNLDNNSNFSNMANN